MIVFRLMGRRGRELKYYIGGAKRVRNFGVFFRIAFLSRHYVHPPPVPPFVPLVQYQRTESPNDLPELIEWGDRYYRSQNKAKRY